jgi:CRP-like cAMP-binding protein
MAGELTDLLRRVPLFSELRDDDLAYLAQVAVPRTFARGEVVFRAGDEGDTCYIVRSGEARAFYEHDGGRAITLSHFRPGDIFGELAIFDSERRAATVEMVEDTELLAILGADMRRLIELHPDVAIKLLTSLGKRLRETNERLARQSFQTVPGRVAATLSQLVAAHPARRGSEPEAAHGTRSHSHPAAQGAQSHSHPAAQGAHGGSDPGAPRAVQIASTQAALARLAGCSRESVSRFLAILERAGIISQGRGKLTVHDAEALERYVY